MMHHLQPHPDTPRSAVQSLAAEAARTELGDLVFHYRLQGNLEALKLPKAVAYGSRADELWQTTCFEAFVNPVGRDAYLEFNFAPSTAWAGYKLDRYRSGLTALDIPLCQIDVEPTGTQLDMFIMLDASDHIDIPMDRDWRVGLSAIIEEKDGTKSYWALKHPPGAPDFHHPDCFVLDLPAA